MFFAALQTFPTTLRESIKVKTFFINRYNFKNRCKGTAFQLSTQIMNKKKSEKLFRKKIKNKKQTTT